MSDDLNYYGFYVSPIGWIEVKASEDEISSLIFADRPRSEFATCPVVEEAIRQISEYFNGELRTFDLPLIMDGTSFQRQVWDQLLKIPYGQVTTYQEVAQAIGRPRAVRAVGAANGQNPISIIIPCHRVIGSDGSLTGYGGGIWRKEWLLKHEGYT